MIGWTGQRACSRRTTATTDALRARWVQVDDRRRRFGEVGVMNQVIGGDVPQLGTDHGRSRAAQTVGDDNAFDQVAQDLLAFAAP